jgi:hypothetical protein
MCRGNGNQPGLYRRDSFGNALGGLRTPFLDVPIATYIASNPDDPEGICGKMIYFTHAQVKKLYGTPEHYVELFEQAVKIQLPYRSELGTGLL